jgi:hypothetical protein
LGKQKKQQYSNIKISKSSEILSRFEAVREKLGYRTLTAGILAAIDEFNKNHQKSQDKITAAGQ